MSVPPPFPGVRPIRCLPWSERSSTVPPDGREPTPFLPFPLPLKGGNGGGGSDASFMAAVAVGVRHGLPLTRGYGGSVDASHFGWVRSLPGWGDRTPFVGYGGGMNNERGSRVNVAE